MKVLLVVAKQYNGHELWTTLGTLHSRGHEFEVISTATTIVDEVTFRANTIERTISDLDLAEPFDALMVVSGNMKDTEAYWKHPKVLSLVRKMDAEEKPLAAICCSVPTIREAAFGKRVSFFPLVRSRDLLLQAGAILQTVAMTVDGRLVTAEHQMATQMWAEAFCDVLEKKEPSVKLTDSGFVPQGRERKPIPALERLKKRAPGGSS